MSDANVIVELAPSIKKFTAQIEAMERAVRQLGDAAMQAAAVFLWLTPRPKVGKRHRKQLNTLRKHEAKAERDSYRDWQRAQIGIYR